MKEAIRINVGLLCEVSGAIAAKPTGFDVNDWRFSSRRTKRRHEYDGTMCIAGWAVSLHHQAPIGGIEGTEIKRRARELLRLSEDQANRLFLFGLWPMELQIDYCHLPETLVDYEFNAELACRRINVFIRTDGEL